jgi:hypothetical protein
MEISKAEILNSVGKPLNPKLRTLFIILIFVVIFIAFIVFLILTEYIKISDPVNG